MSILSQRYRYVIGLLLLSSCIAGYLGRVNLSNAIVDMSQPKSTVKQVEFSVCRRQSDNFIHSLANSSSPSFSTSDAKSYKAPKYDWNEKTQGIILSAFYWGYILFLVPSGLLLERFGTRLLVSLSIYGTAVINAATPWLASTSLVGLIVSRVALGILQAIVFPSAFSLASRWIPENERSTFLALSSAGAQIGSILGFSISGYLCQNGFAGGWPSVFYVSAVICLVIGLLYTIGVTDDPEQNRWVSRAEFDYIVQNSPALRREKLQKDCQLQQQQQQQLEQKSEQVITDYVFDSTPRPSFPWKRAFTSPAILSFFLLRFTSMIFFVIVMTKMPTYIKTVIGASIQRNGFYFASINLVCAISIMCWGIAADWMWRKAYFRTKTALRKTFEFVASFGPAIIVSLIPFTGCNEIAFLVMMYSSQITYGFNSGGSYSIPADMSARFTATIFACGNVAAMGGGMFTPIIVGTILDSDPAEPKKQWSFIFYGVSIISIIGYVIFFFFGSAEELPWEIETETSDNDSSETFSDNNQNNNITNNKATIV